LIVGRDEDCQKDFVGGYKEGFVDELGLGYLLN
jgi:hypothetical protein